ncbi:hypothetical protein CPB83DRAFT_835363 [Crepidotus variabilis]|uniref:Uncharacterized protein n=1 Tax=Crepidotus variabilis TaxID=179855 RepID=A0A9P6EHU1_9AGAR|nr:hypothetical protein CPB83DRAFT_835363 [Crepidotus variabilis]
MSPRACLSSKSNELELARPYLPASLPWLVLIAGTTGTLGTSRPSISATASDKGFGKLDRDSGRGYSDDAKDQCSGNGIPEPNDENNLGCSVFAQLESSAKQEFQGRVGGLGKGEWRGWPTDYRWDGEYRYWAVLLVVETNVEVDIAVAWTGHLMIVINN